MTDDSNKNMFLAIGASFAILLVWQLLVGFPTDKPQTASKSATVTAPADPLKISPAPATANSPSLPGTTTAAAPSAAPSSARIAIETPLLKGSLSLDGARIDELSLTGYREKVDPKSRVIELFQSAQSLQPYYAEFGWLASDPAAGAPQAQTQWKQVEGKTLTVGQPVVLETVGNALTVRRKIEIDDRYLFRVTDTLTNTSTKPLKVNPYALIARHGTPATQGFFILHEGLVGVLGSEGLQEFTYSKMKDEKQKQWKATGGFIGITDKYWAAAIIPDAQKTYEARFTAAGSATTPVYQTDYLLEGVELAPAASTQITHRLFAGAKEVTVIDAYKNKEGIMRFDLLIDWGWFYFITKPMFTLINWLNHLLGNFGLAILAATVIIKIFFFPLANKSYESMTKMKKVHPDMMSIRERYKDDKMKQQQELMELYRREKINPAAGCLPVLLQIPVFFALYKVLFVTIEMRHAPFYGWIRDLAAPDPTSLFNLFGLIPWTPPSLLMLGVWPILMGITMFIQMQMNPPPADPTQRILFGWMPIIFTFMLASFPAGLVIYWTWNNLLSILQQWVIMRRMGVNVELMNNVKVLLGMRPASS